ncbi:MAG: TIGR04348 family glycosyltransferase [SAR324 cluster bacterium]|nr:TIGR04348 family glycosyltransferase [SAR324 cluster bacterium]
MKIILTTPAPAHSRTGNRVTAIRWARILKELGHQVLIKQNYEGQACDLMIALHARRSFPAIERFSHLFPERPLVVALTGTDLYQDIQSDRDAQHSLKLANRLVVLQAMGIEELPQAFRAKTRVIYQSFPKPKKTVKKNKTTFDICVVGHLRPVKDPFLAAFAVRKLPANSNIRLLHVGGALSDEMEANALREMQHNSRYHWLRERPRWETKRILSRSRLLIHSSIMEGGANAISEALVLSVPILSSHISGSIGMLGSDYPGYFQVGDAESLTEQLVRIETDPEYLKSLQEWCDHLAPLFDPERELGSWKDLLDELT